MADVAYPKKIDFTVNYGVAGFRLKYVIFVRTNSIRSAVMFLILPVVFLFLHIFDISMPIVYISTLLKMLSI